MTQKKLKPHQLFAGFVALAILASAFIPGLLPDTAATRTLCVLLFTLLLLIFEIIPLSIVCLVSVVLLYALKCVNSFPEALCGYSNHILYFTMASFGLSAALSKSLYCQRMLFSLFSRFRASAKSILISIMLCTAVLSAFISNVAATVIFLPYALQFIDFYQGEEKTQAKRVFMIGITLAAMIGGMSTPAGSSINLLVIDALEKSLGLTIPFVKWMGYGVPMVACMLTLAVLILTQVFPLPALPQEEINRFLSTLRQDQREASSMDKYIFILISATIVTWIASSWLPALNTSVIAVIALALLFIPGYSVLTWEEFNKANSWPAFFIAGTMISVGTAVVSSGLAEQICNSLFPNISGLPLPIAMALIAGATFIFMLAVPVAPASASILLPIVCMFATANGLNPTLLAMACGLCVENCYLLPLDTVPVVTFSQNGYRMFDLPKVTVWLQLAMIAVISILFTLINVVIPL